jgi:DNA-binding NarL/FixJ family response regulator
MAKILIVEDNATFRQSFREILCNKFPSKSIEEAADAKEALQKVDEIHPDLIFIDIKLPDENGLKLTKKIKAAHPQTTVIILTSYNIPEYREAAKQYGATHFLIKSSSSGKQIIELAESILSNINGNHNAQNKKDKNDGVFKVSNT